MGKVYPELDQRLTKFIARQPVFFVATAPCLTRDGNGGHINLSPKGYRGTFAILGPATVAYLDLTGSGAETIAHLRQNGQITIMFCSFEQQPKILRLYGAGRVVLPGEPRWDELAGHFPKAGTGRGSERAIIVVDVHRIADSCGYAVPLMDLVEERDLQIRWADGKSAGELAAYRAEKNAVSIDGLPALAEAEPGSGLDRDASDGEVARDRPAREAPAGTASPPATAPPLGSRKVGACGSR
ncbi:MAG: pyridoxamine 5'-phosphate oxidase family protein [Streptosporangiaceae bacterium]